MSNEFTPRLDQICSGYAEVGYLKSEGTKGWDELYWEAVRGIRALEASAWKDGYESRKRQTAQNPPMGFPGHIKPENPYERKAKR